MDDAVAAVYDRRTADATTPARRSQTAATKNATLADLYDPLAMPPALAQAHAALDRAVDLCYRPEKFETDRQRVEFLFALYEKLTAPLLPAAKTKGRRKQ
jgi:hypothetical protein